MKLNNDWVILRVYQWLAPTQVATAYAKENVLSLLLKVWYTYLNSLTVLFDINTVTYCIAVLKIYILYLFENCLAVQMLINKLLRKHLLVMYPVIIGGTSIGIQIKLTNKIIAKKDLH